jgi:malonyl-CoA decarboxylase
MRRFLRRRDEADGGELSARERETFLLQMRESIEGRRGEANAMVHAAGLRTAYLELPPDGRHEFLGLNASELGLDRERLAELARAMLDADGDERRVAEEALRQALDAPWLRLLRLFNRLPDGTRFLLELRTDLLRLSAQDPALLPLERDLKRVLEAWFDTGFLELRRVTWDSPASLLERLAASEAVHTVVGWGDLKDRLDADRRFYACVHPHLPGDPLTFVEVALTRGIPDTIGAVLDQEAPTVDPTGADTAVFYSISNVEPGLRGVPFGHFVIRKAMEELLAELPQLRVFATISPIPGFRAWLESQDAAAYLDRQERRELDVHEFLARDWAEDERASSLLRKPLLRMCAAYLVDEATDAVLRFHLSNGARLERLSWLADRSPRGMAQSAGVMAHYVYDPGQVEANHEAFSGRGEIVASDSVKRLAREARQKRQRHAA